MLTGLRYNFIILLLDDWEGFNVLDEDFAFIGFLAWALYFYVAHILGGFWVWLFSWGAGMPKIIKN